MNLLDSLNEKMRDELEIKKSADDKKKADGTESEEDDEFESDDDNSRSRVRVETESKIIGIIRNLNYDIKFKDLADRLRDEVPGVSITRDKAKKIFNVVKEMVGF